MTASPASFPSIPDFARRPGLLFVDGRFVEAASGRTFDTINPATEEVLTSVAEGDAADIDLAVAAARRAFEDGPWPRMAARERGRILQRIADLVLANAEELALLEVLDNGKPISEARAVDIPQSAEVFAYYGGWSDKVSGQVVPVSGDFHAYTLREPVGVCGQIIPWNFPLLMAAWKIAPALACGNTVVLKPAEQTPLTALRLAELLQQAGVPPGVVNVVTGFGPTAGAVLAAHPGVDKVAFTGSTEVGRSIQRAAAGNLKRVSLELGGKSPNIVFADADLDRALQGVAGAIFFNQGEVCCAGSRLFVEQSVHEQFTARLVEHARGLRVGDPLDEATQVGSLVSREQMARVCGCIASGREEGATLLAGGGRVGQRGFFVEPTVFGHVEPRMRIAREEIFGPVLCVTPFRDFEEVVAAANATAYGLAASVWTRDLSRAHRAAKALRAGTVWINSGNAFDAAMPFGGCKESGFGRESGKQALDLYTQDKAVWVGL